MPDDSAEQAPQEGNLLDLIGERGRRFSTGILGGERAIFDNLLTFRGTAAIAGMSGPSGPSGVVSRSTDFAGTLPSLLSYNEAQRNALRVQAEQPVSRFADQSGRQLHREAEPATEAAPAEPISDDVEANAEASNTSWIADMEKKFAVAKERVNEYLDRQIPSGPSAAQLESMLGEPRTAETPAGGGDGSTIRRRSRIQEVPTGVRIDPPQPEVPPATGTEVAPTMEGPAAPNSTGTPDSAAVQRTPAAPPSPSPATPAGPTVARPIRQRRRGSPPPEALPETSPAQASVEPVPEPPMDEPEADTSAPPATPVQRRVVAATPQPPPAPATPVAGASRPAAVRAVPAAANAPLQRRAAPETPATAANIGAPPADSPDGAESLGDDEGPGGGASPAVPPAPRPPAPGDAEVSPPVAQRRASSSPLPSEHPSGMPPAAAEPTASAAPELPSAGPDAPGPEAPPPGSSATSAADIAASTPAESPSTRATAAASEGGNAPLRRRTSSPEPEPPRNVVRAEPAAPQPTGSPDLPPLARRTDVASPSAATSLEPSVDPDEASVEQPDQASDQVPAPSIDHLPAAEGVVARSAASLPGTDTSPGREQPAGVSQSRAEPPAPAQANEPRVPAETPVSDRSVPGSTPEPAASEVQRTVTAEPPAAMLESPNLTLASPEVPPRRNAPASEGPALTTPPGPSPEVAGPPAAAAGAASGGSPRTTGPVQRSSESESPGEPPVAPRDMPAVPTGAETASTGSSQSEPTRAQAPVQRLAEAPVADAPPLQESGEQSAQAPRDEAAPARPGTADRTLVEPDAAGEPGAKPELVFRSPERSASGPQAGQEPTLVSGTTQPGDDSGPGQSPAPVADTAAAAPAPAAIEAPLQRSADAATVPSPAATPGAPAGPAHSQPSAPLAAAGAERPLQRTALPPTGPAPAAGMGPQPVVSAPPPQPAIPDESDVQASPPLAEQAPASEPAQHPAIQRVVASAPAPPAEPREMPLATLSSLAAGAAPETTLVAETPDEIRSQPGGVAPGLPQQSSGDATQEFPAGATSVDAIPPAAVQRATGAAEPPASAPALIAAPMGRPDASPGVPPAARRSSAPSVPLQRATEEGQLSAPPLGVPAIEPALPSAAFVAGPAQDLATGHQATAPAGVAAAAVSRVSAAASQPLVSRPVAVQRSAEPSNVGPGAASTATVAEPQGMSNGSLVVPLAQPVQRAPAPPPQMPLAAAAPVQRTLEETPSNTVSMGSESGGEATSKEPNIDELTEKVWRKLEHRLRVERERQFGLP